MMFFVGDFTQFNAVYKVDVFPHPVGPVTRIIPCALDNIDSKFYKTAESFFQAYNGIGLTFDDVTLATLYSEILPRERQLAADLAEGLCLHIPIISSDMDTVTESRMAIAMALNGGLGLIHYNMPEREQLSEVSRVKHHVHGLIQEPIKVAPDQFIGDVLELIDGTGLAIIFVTAFDQYAMKAFDVHAVDYLLKPFSKERFEAALERAKGREGKKQVDAAELTAAARPAGQYA